MGIGQLKCHVIDVNDLAVAEEFWSQVTGLDVIPSVFPGRYSYLGQADPWRHDMILHLVTAEKGAEPNRSHVDIWVRDVDEANRRIEAIGGTLKRPPVIYPKWTLAPGETPRIDWSVMQDPFGNEFCVIRPLTPEQSDAVVRLADTGEEDDDVLRAAARHIPDSTG